MDARLEQEMERMEQARKARGEGRSGLSACTLDECALLDRVFHDCAFSVVRQSGSEFDLLVSGERVVDQAAPGGLRRFRFSAWLPLAALRELTLWTSRAVAGDCDHPDMAREGDWSGIRDSSNATLWAMFRRHVLDPKMAAWHKRVLAGSR